MGVGFKTGASREGKEIERLHKYKEIRYVTTNENFPKVQYYWISMKDLNKCWPKKDKSEYKILKRHEKVHGY